MMTARGEEMNGGSDRSRGGTRERERERERQRAEALPERPEIRRGHFCGFARNDSGHPASICTIAANSRIASPRLVIRSGPQHELSRILSPDERREDLRDPLRRKRAGGRIPPKIRSIRRDGIAPHGAIIEMRVVN